MEVVGQSQRVGPRSHARVELIARRTEDTMPVLPKAPLNHEECNKPLHSQKDNEYHLPVLGKSTSFRDREGCRCFSGQFDGEHQR